ncbi:hypothetical protein JOB18_038880 [Solea senegalensis]|uniref:Uncharacterized protein n=1 Tax=Solea senegalensis TaxID=28829 RepID=A0AAV6SCI7_SOLSE|nr:hypothetical protein JOB18_038880 [Solea senegalensis]
MPVKPKRNNVSTESSGNYPDPDLDLDLSPPPCLCCMSPPACVTVDDRLFPADTWRPALSHPVSTTEAVYLDIKMVSLENRNPVGRLVRGFSTAVGFSGIHVCFFYIEVWTGQHHGQV